MQQKDITNPIKVFMIMVCVFLALSIFSNTKLSNWENASPQNSFRDATLQYLAFAKNYNFFKDVKIGQEYEEYVSDKEYDLSDNQIINEDQRNHFIKAISPPYRALIVGDSFIAGSLGIEIERNLNLYKNFNVLREAKSSTGLTRPDYYDWNQKITQLISDNKPNIVIVMFGANDGQNIPIGDNNGYAYGTNEWDREYGKRVYSFLKILKDNDIFVIWIGNPIARDSQYSQKMSHLNQIYQKESAKFLNCEFLPTWDLLIDVNGNYTDFIADKNGQMVLAREPDGIHVNYFGGKLIAENIVLKLSDYFKIESK